MSASTQTAVTLCDKEHAERISAAVPRDDRACDRFEHFVKAEEFRDLLLCRSDDLFVRITVRHKTAARIVFGIARGEVGNILLDAAHHAAAVFFARDELPVVHIDERMDLEDVRPVQRKAGTASPLVEIVKAVGDEGGVDVGPQRVDDIHDLLHAPAFLAKICGAENEKPLPRRKPLAVHDKDFPGKIFGSLRRIGMRRGRLGGNAEVDDGIALLDEGTEEVLVLADAGSRRLGELPRPVDIGKDVLRDDIHAVTELLVSEDDGERHDADIALCNALAEIAGTVCCDLDHGFLLKCSG